MRILVVEGEEDTRRMVGMLLEGCGAEVKTAPRAPEAFEVYEAWWSGVMVCDIGMPEEDSYAFIRWVRAAEAGLAERTPAAALTGYAPASPLPRTSQVLREPGAGVPAELRNAHADQVSALRPLPL